MTLMAPAASRASEASRGARDSLARPVWRGPYLISANYTGADELDQHRAQRELGYLFVACGEQVYILDEPYVQGHGGNTCDLWAYASRFPRHDVAFSGWLPVKIIGPAVHSLDTGADEPPQADADVGEPDPLNLWWSED